MASAPRNQVILVWASLGALPILAAQLFLIGRGDLGAASILGPFGMAYVVGWFFVWRRSGLSTPTIERLLPDRWKRRP
jgi:hypothetical protein